MRTTLFPAVLLALPLVALPAQQVTGSSDQDRRTSTVMVQTEDRGVLAAVSIAYGAPAWREEHDGTIEQLRGNNYSRLGIGWWTTLDTVGPIEIGGTRIEAGSYYLGLQCGPDGACSLLLFDSSRAMQRRLLPFSTTLYTGAAKADLAAPLTFVKAARKEVIAKLEIEITADRKEPTKGTLALRWGRHEATAPLKFELVKDGTAAGGTK